MFSAPRVDGIQPDEGILAHNLALIAQTSPQAARAILNAVPRGDLVWVRCADGTPAASTAGDRVQLCSLVDAMAEARMFAESVDPHTAGAVVVLGFGVGHHVAELARRMRGLGIVRVFEPDAGLLRAVLERVNIGPWFRFGNVAIYTDPNDTAAIASGLSGSEALPVIGTRIMTHAPSRRRLGSGAARFGDSFARVIKAVRTNVVTTLVQVETTIRNQLQNIDRYATVPGIAELKDAAKGRPAIVVAAGPSLHRNVELLRQPGIRDRFVIIAVQTVLKQLLALGVKPHFVTAIDHHEISRRFYEGLTAEMLEGVTLVADSKANPAIFDSFKGEIRCPQETTLDRVLGITQEAGQAGLSRPMGELPPGATVAHTAYYLARYLGCDPVIFIGQDLGFTDGQYYSAGAAIHGVWAGELNPFNSLEMLEWQRIARMKSLLRKRTDQHGRPIYTDEQMSTYLVQFERDFAEDAARGLRVIDATEGGVAKLHTTISTLADAIAACDDPGAPAIQFPRGRSLPSARLDAVRARLGMLRADTDCIAALSTETLTLLEQLRVLPPENRAANALVERIHAKRDKVVSLKAAYWLTQFLNQTGTLNRFKADRALKIDAELPESQQQQRRIARDIDNVRWLADAAAAVRALLDDAIATLKGGARITRDRTAPLQDGPAGDSGTASEASVSTNGSAARLRIAAIVQTDTVLSGRGLPRDLSRPIRDGRNALQLTLERLRSACACDLIIVATDDVVRARQLAGIDAKERDGRAPVHFVAVDPGALRAHSSEVGIGRAFSPACWRGGLGDLSVFDEACCPATLEPIFAAFDLHAAALVGAEWCEIDCGLLDEAVSRLREDPERHHMTFVHAPPGIGTAVLSRTVIDELAAHRGPFATLGALLGYIPIAPQADPIAKPACISAPPSVRDLPRRFIADGEVATDESGRNYSLTDASHLELNLFTTPALSEPVPLSSAAFAAVERHLRTHPDTAVTLTTDSRAADATDHPELFTFIHHLRAAGATAIHIRTTLACDSALAEGLLNAVDVISIDLVAADAATFASVLNRSHPGRCHRAAELFEQARANLELLLTLRDSSPGTQACGLPRPWLVPRIPRRDDTIEHIEALYDTWLMRCGAATIDPEIPLSPGARVRPLPLPVVARERLAREMVRFSIETGGLEFDERGDLVELAEVAELAELTNPAEPAAASALAGQTTLAPFVLNGPGLLPSVMPAPASPSAAPARSAVPVPFTSPAVSAAPAA